MARDAQDNQLAGQNLSLALATSERNIPLSAAFRDIRNYLAGRAVGISQDKALLEEVIKCLFCALHSAGESLESDSELATEYRATFDHVKQITNGTFDSKDELQLDPSSIAYVHRTLKSVDLGDPRNDPLSEAYQTFVSSEIRHKEGQFFTPPEAVSWLVEAVAPKRGERIIDPACGSGSFLSYAARYLFAAGISKEEIRSSIFGIDKDRYLCHLASTHLALVTLGSPNILCADSIEGKTQDGKAIPFELEESYDVVLANPPFGARIKVGSEEAQRRFDLAFKWKTDKSGMYARTDSLSNNPTPQVLFVELCLRLLKPGGRMGIVVPESMIANTSAGHVSQFIQEKAHLLAVVGMPESLFKTSGKGGTHTKTCLVVAEKKAGKRRKPVPIFMAEAKWCGHDSRGNPIPHNDLPEILGNYRKGKAGGETRLGYLVKEVNNNILAPRYYDPTPLEQLQGLEGTHDLLRIQDLVADGVLSLSTGDEVGKLAYGTGDVPFVRTSDISNWEIKTDPKHCVSEEVYEDLRSRQDVREGDVLVVKDGTYLIGTCAYVSKYDTRIVYQSHLYKLRIHKPDIISPYLLLAALSSQPVVAQIQSKRFTQDIIDSLGRRIYELVLPIPKGKKARQTVEKMVQQSIHDRIEARELAREAKRLIAAP